MRGVLSAQLRYSPNPFNGGSYFLHTFEQIEEMQINSILPPTFFPPTKFHTSSLFPFWRLYAMREVVNKTFYGQADCKH